MTLALKKDERYTYKDYLSWQGDERWELIDGVPYCMSPAPSRLHQDIVRNIMVKFANFLEGKSCKVYDAPFDVRLSFEEEKEEDVVNVVQPDIVVVCDKKKLDDRGCKGAPDLVVEVLSPATGKKDMHEKFVLYEKAGVKEYWVIYPKDKTIVVFVLEGEKYDDGTVYTVEKSITTNVLENFRLNLEDAFKQ